MCLVTSVWHSVCRLIALRAFIDKENNYKPHRGELDPVRSPIDPSNLLGAILIEDVAIVLHVATQLRDIDGVCVVQLFGELWLLLVSQDDRADCHCSHHVGDSMQSFVVALGELARVDVVLEVVAFAVDGVSLGLQYVEAWLRSAEVEASLALEVVEEGEVVHGGADGAIGGQLEGGAGGVLGVGDQHR